MVEGNNRLGSPDLASVATVPLEQLKASPVVIDGEVIHVGKLSINQVIAVARLFTDAAARMGGEQRDKLREFAKAAEGGDTEDLLAQIAMGLSVLDEGTVNRTLGVILRRDAAWCGEHVGIADLALVVEGLLEHNDVQTVRAVFFRQMERFKPSRSSTPE